MAKKPDIDAMLDDVLKGRKPAFRLTETELQDAVDFVMGGDIDNHPLCKTMALGHVHRATLLSSEMERVGSGQAFNQILKDLYDKLLEHHQKNPEDDFRIEVLSIPKE